MKRVLITGAGGFIGRSLSRYFLQKGYKVYGADLFEEGMQGLKKEGSFIPIIVKRDSFDMLDTDELKGTDLVYHLGWAGKLGGPDLNDFDMQISNVIMTEKLLRKVIEIKAGKFVFCGSISHYKMVKGMEQEVNSDIYGLSKMYAAKLSMTVLEKEGISSDTVLLANTFGVGDYSDKAVNTLLKRFHSEDHISLIDGDTPNDWVYIDDTVRGLAAAGEYGKAYKEYYIGHRTIPTFRENIETMKKVMDSHAHLQFGTYEDNVIADYGKVDLEALYRDTGFECRHDLADALRRTAEWLKENDRL